MAETKFTMILDELCEAGKVILGKRRKEISDLLLPIIYLA